jgi:hypothetical protein
LTWSVKINPGNSPPEPGEMHAKYPDGLHPLPILTTEIALATFGVTPGEHSQLKGLTRDFPLINFRPGQPAACCSGWATASLPATWLSTARAARSATERAFL